ncbi:secretory pathway protein ysy6-like protein [Apiospora kogelbergensis]
MAQTPEQRRRNAKFAKEQEARRGKSEDAIKKHQHQKTVSKAPISPIWLILLAFVVFGGLIFELIQRVFFR